MVIVDQFRITDDGKNMLLQAHVSDAVDASDNPLYNNVYIKKVVIKTASMTSEAAPEIFDEDYIYKIEYDENPPRNIEIVLTPEALMEKFPKNTFTQDLFFVFIEETDYECDLPCSCCKPETTAVTFDESLLYQRAMGYIKELSQECDTPSKGFIDFILLWNAFKASVETEHWTSAVKFYKMLFMNIQNNTYTKNCGCHG